MGSTHDEIVIIGAGPGGVAAALTLAKAGIPCTIVDKATFPRDKVCGDAVSGKAIAWLNRIDPEIMGRFQQSSQQYPSWGVTFVAPNGKELRIPFQRGYQSATGPAPGFISRRLVFDHYLVKQMERYPTIHFRENHAITSWERKRNGWVLHGSSGNPDLYPRLVIAANGAQSAFARKVGGHFKEPKHYCAGIRSYWQGVEGLDPDGFIELHFLKTFLPGYLWIFPLPNGAANVGIGMRSDQISRKKVDLKKSILDLVQRDPALSKRFQHASMEDSIRGWGLPLGSKQRSLSGDGYLLVGDATSLIDPFTGEGIGNAIVTGHLAAQQAVAALENTNVSVAFLKEFDEEVYRILGKELRLSTGMQWLVRYPWLFNFVVNKAKRNSELQELMSNMFEDLDIRQQLKRPGFYWKLIWK